MELSLRSGFDAEVGDEGMVSVPGKTFLDIVRLRSSPWTGSRRYCAPVASTTAGAAISRLP